jgi:hypothetical protein
MTSIARVAGIAYVTDQLSRLKAPGPNQRGAAPLQRCVDSCRIRPPKLPSRGLLKKSAARSAAGICLAIDAIKQLIGH